MKILTVNSEISIYLDILGGKIIIRPSNSRFTEEFQKIVKFYPVEYIKTQGILDETAVLEKIKKQIQKDFPQIKEISIISL